MEVKGRFDHFNFNVLDLDKSIRFYEEALGLKEVRRMEASDGSFILVYMGESHSNICSTICEKKEESSVRSGRAEES